MTDFEAHLTRQIAFSRATFGPGERTEGVSDHIRKELAEIGREATPKGRANEWIDVAILGLDGLWRALAAAYPDVPPHQLAQFAAAMIVAKQGKNELRVWPDWRTAPADKAIEHDRSGE